MAPSTSMTAALALVLQALPGSWSAPTTLNPRQAPKVITYPANPNIGPGGSTFLDSPHFRVYGNDGADAQTALDKLEAAFQCFVRGPFAFTGTGRSFNDPDKTGKLTKTNIYAVDSLDGGAAGVMHSDFETGMGYVDVVQDYLATSGVTVHEWGHALHYHQRTWVDQGNTGAWWEMFANWVADTYATSNECAKGREQYGQAAEPSSIDLNKVIGDSFQVIVDGSQGSGNYYQSWPFLTYLTNNPDNIAGLGAKTLKQMMVQYAEDSNETPLHTLQRVVGESASVAELVGRYWAHMAYVDIGSAPAHEVFEATRDQLNYENVQSSGNGYQVIADRAPQYMGANIIPLTVSGETVSVDITSEGDYTAFLAVSSGSGVAYTKVNGTGEAKVPADGEASLVVANTPQELIMYDAFALNAEVSKGLQYSFTLTGGSVA